MVDSKNRYTRLIEHIFFAHFSDGDTEIIFKRDELVSAASELKIHLPKNIGDIIYSFRYRAALPMSICEKAPEGKVWIIRPAGKAVYKMVAIEPVEIVPNVLLITTKVPNATPGIIQMYSLNDEQALLARLRYNRLLDIMTGVTCYSLQNHLRTYIEGMGQIETDEIYIGIDRRGAHYVFPIQAKGGTDKLNIVQIEQDFALCAQKFPNLICKAVAAQFMSDDLIALFLFEESETGVSLSMEKHYRLVSQDEISIDDLDFYRSRLNEE